MGLWRRLLWAHWGKPPPHAAVCVDGPGMSGRDTSPCRKRWSGQKRTERLESVVGSTCDIGVTEAVAVAGADADTTAFQDNFHHSVCCCSFDRLRRGLVPIHSHKHTLTRCMTHTLPLTQTTSDPLAVAVPRGTSDVATRTASRSPTRSPTSTIAEMEQDSQGDVDTPRDSSRPAKAKKRVQLFYNGQPLQSKSSIVQSLVATGRETKPINPAMHVRGRTQHDFFETW